MECPHCKKPLPGRTCPACGTVIPEYGHFCLECGVRLDEEISDDRGQEEDLDLDDRILCPDGTCTGIIVDGRCSECGRPYKEESAREA